MRIITPDAAVTSNSERVFDVPRGVLILLHTVPSLVVRMSDGLISWFRRHRCPYLRSFRTQGEILYDYGIDLYPCMTPTGLVSNRAERSRCIITLVQVCLVRQRLGGTLDGRLELHCTQPKVLMQPSVLENGWHSVLERNG